MRIKQKDHIISKCQQEIGGEVGNLLVVPSVSTCLRQRN